MKFAFLLLFLFSISAQAGGKRFDRVLVVVLENMNLADVEKDPYFSTLASRGATFDNYGTLARPSYPNYLAMTAGSSLGVTSNTQQTFAVRHLGTLLEENGLDWKVFAENYPGDCFLGSTASGGYARKHVPFLSFKDVQDDKQRCAKVVSEKSFPRDLGKLPAYSLYIPNLDNDGHDTNLAFASKWLKGFLEPILTAKNMDRMLVVVTFDESLGSAPGPIFTAAIGAGVRPGLRISVPTDHYGLLRTIEDNFSLGTLGQMDAKAHPIALWQ